MRATYYIFFLCLIPFTSLGERPDTGDDIQQCYSGDQDAASSVMPEDCMEAKREASEKVMKSKLNKVNEYIRKRFNDPYHLNNDENSETIDEVFSQHLTVSQDAWIKSRDNLCQATVSLMGEWASSRSVAISQCIIKLNKSRTDELEDYFIRKED